MNENEERKFLHDIASPLATALFLQDVVVDDLEERPDADPRDLKQAKQMLELLRRMKGMIEARRATLIERTARESSAA